MTTQTKTGNHLNWVTVERCMSRLDLLNMVDSYWVFLPKHLFWIHPIEEFMYFVLNWKIITEKKFNILQYVWLLLKIPNRHRNYTFISKTIRNDRVKKLKNFVRRHLEFCNLFLWRSKEIMSCMKMRVVVSCRSVKISIDFWRTHFYGEYMNVDHNITICSNKYYISALNLFCNYGFGQIEPLSSPKVLSKSTSVASSKTQLFWKTFIY